MKLRGIIPRIAALFTYALEDHPAGENFKVLPNLLRYVQVVVLIVVKIKYFPAGNTVQVMVAIPIGVEALGAAIYLYNIHDANISKGQHRAAYCIVGNIGKFLFEDLIHIVHGGMGGGTD
jgi:hypothetical protein